VLILNHKPSERPVTFVTPQDIASGLILEDPEYSREFEPVLWLVLEDHDIRMDPTIPLEKQRETQDIGLLSSRFWHWQVSINWSTQWNEGVPPHHYRVRYKGEEVAVMSPYFLFRTCPFCRLGDPCRNGEYDISWLFLYRYCPRHPITGQETVRDLPACAPAHACRGPYWEGRLLGTCRRFDWFGPGMLLGSQGLDPRQVFQRDVAEELAVRTNKDRLAVEMAQPDDRTSPLLASDIGKYDPTTGEVVAA